MQKLRNLPSFEDDDYFFLIGWAAREKIEGGAPELVHRLIRQAIVDKKAELPDDAEAA